jgi:hypothetical protein
VPRLRAVGNARTTYEADKFTRYQRRMCERFGNYFPHEDELIKTYSELMAEYQRIAQGDEGWWALEVSDADLAHIVLVENLVDTFLTDADYCALDADSDAYRDLIPNRSSLAMLPRKLAAWNPATTEITDE